MITITDMGSTVASSPSKKVLGSSLVADLSRVRMFSPGLHGFLLGALV